MIAAFKSLLLFWLGQGPWQGSRQLAKQAAAFSTCVALHQMGELDDHLQPVVKESIQLEQHLCPPPPTDLDPEAFPRPGTTKRRQYYYKKVASCLTTGCNNLLLSSAMERLSVTNGIAETDVSSPVVVYLYAITMVMQCAIPDQQNTRGRRIYRPEQSPRDFGILTTHAIPQTSAFPVFTRSGEVLVTLQQVATSSDRPSLKLSMEQLDNLNTFHQFTFTHVLRLEKYPIKFDPLRANASYFVVPLLSEPCWQGGFSRSIDWKFVTNICEAQDVRQTSPTDAQRKLFSFNREQYEDAVVMPWYRNHDQPQVRGTIFSFHWLLWLRRWCW